MIRLLAVALVLVFSASCQQSGNQKFQSPEPLGQNLVQLVTGQENRTIGDNKVQFQVLAEQRQASGPSLILGYPTGLLGENMVFGGVITKVSDSQNENLGNLKLADIPPIHGKLVLDPSKTKVVYYGCEERCDETTPLKSVLEIPVVSIDAQKNQVMIDIAAIGKNLNLLSEVDPFGMYTMGLKTIDNKAVLFDYSLSTLVFDVETHMIPRNADPSTNPPVTVFTSRWYFKLGSQFNPSFAVRDSVKGVGYFKTARSKKSKITRFALTPVDGKPAVHYFIKNVPAEHKASFAAAMDSWNQAAKPIMGFDLLHYEFVDANDPRAPLIVAGDVRFNVIEWDLLNRAGYGGLGPSIAHQFTGEIFSANVLVQGPEIIRLYKKWFQVTTAAASLEAQGKIAQAEKLIRDFHVERQQERQASSSVKWAMSLNKNLEFRIVSQMPSYEDPLESSKEFYELPTGVSYENYMDGYFKELVAHEVGHNLGLRHNFKGNLGDTGTGQVGSTSRSVMEYLGRAYRHLNRISAYDTMALAYGYMGVPPQVDTWYCTDEDSATPNSPTRSAECSNRDNTNDSFKYFQSMLDRGLTLLTGAGHQGVPEWSLKDMEEIIKPMIHGLLLYADNAETMGNTWTNFFNDPTRPKDVMAVKSWVMDQVRNQICDPSIEAALNSKTDPAAQQVARKNVTDLRGMVDTIKGTYSKLSKISLSCNP